jgi:membrane associated rhomboid family serine protease
VTWCSWSGGIRSYVRQREGEPAVIIPIGHDKGLRRLPYATIAIIAICTALEIYRSFTAPSWQELEDAQENQLRALRSLVEELDAAGAPFDAEALARGDYRGVDHPLVEHVQRFDRALAGLEQQDVAMRFAWSPDQGVSLNLILYAFVHAGWLHLVGNMLFLWLAGMAIEDRWGHAALAIFYAAAAAAAAYAYALWHPGTSLPMVGASGAVAGCMGAFLIAYARVRIRLAYFFWFPGRSLWGTFDARALYALPLWFVEEAFHSWFEAHGVGGVAHSAHVGGFVFGMALAFALKRSGVEARHLMLDDEVDEEWSRKNPELDQGLVFERAGQRVPALGCFRRVLAREPGHPVARAHALDCAIELRNADVVRELGEGAVREIVKDGDRDAAAAHYTRLRDAGLAGALSDRSLADLARLCLPGPAHGPVGVHIVRQLLEAPTPSPLLPGLLWQVAEIQAAAGHADMAARTLGKLIDRFPLDPFADSARARLAAAPAQPDSSVAAS